MNRIEDPQRLEALERTTLLDTPAEESFDRVSRLASITLDAPVVILSLVTGTRQFFKSAVGMGKPWSEKRETALTHSFCQWVVEDQKTFIVPDSLKEKKLKGNRAIDELDVRSYLGAPILIEGGYVIGAFAVIDSRPRTWSERDVEIVEEYAKIASDEIELRMKIATEEIIGRQLSESREQFQSLLESTGEAIYGLNPDGFCTFANRACIQLLGYDDFSELYGQNMHELIHHTDAQGGAYPQDKCKVYQALKAGEGVTVDDEFYWRKDGTGFPAEYRAYPVLKAGEVRGSVVAFHDITERVETLNELNLARQRAEESDRQKTQFLANMSHEIRTPMNAILGFCELMDMQVESPKAKGYLKVITGAGESLLDLINDILDLSKVESGHVELKDEVLELTALIESVVDILRHMAAEKGISIQVEYADGLPGFVCLDRTRFRQVVLNLVSNAIKFTVEGGVVVRISADHFGDRMGLFISVEDTGCGIPKDQLEKVFKPFHQVIDGDIENAVRGTGLGLSISLRLAQLMGGNITVESEMGSGSTFTFHLNSVEVSDSGPERTFKEGREGRERNLNLLSPSYVLVVDDVEVNRQLICEMFAQSHHRVSEAKSGIEAVDSAKSEKPDVILMDIRMPQLDGRRALQILRNHEELKNIPVVAVTASSLMNQEIQLRKTFCGYLKKPFSRADLFEELSKILPSETSSQSEVDMSDREKSPGAVSSEVKAPQEVIDLLRELEADQWRSTSKSMVVGDVIAFAESLIETGTSFGCKPVEDYGRRLCKAASSFLMTEMEDQMEAFPDFIARLGR